MEPTTEAPYVHTDDDGLPLVTIYGIPPLAMDLIDVSALRVELIGTDGRTVPAASVRVVVEDAARG